MCKLLIHALAGIGNDEAENGLKQKTGTIAFYF